MTVAMMNPTAHDAKLHLLPVDTILLAGALDRQRPALAELANLAIDAFLMHGVWLAGWAEVIRLATQWLDAEARRRDRWPLDPAIATVLRTECISAYRRRCEEIVDARLAAMRSRLAVE